jgi:hypothetical protein
MVAASQSQVLTVAKWINVSAYREATIVGRLHAMNFNQAPSYKVEVFAEAPTEEDPSIDFINSLTAATTNNVLLSSQTAPGIAIMNVNAPFGGFLRIKLTGIQGATASTIFNMTLSFDIIAKS